MLRTTVACFAAGVGGADAVTVLPVRRRARAARRRSPGGSPATPRRCCVEEAHLARVVDPAGGSWYVESLTDELAQRGVGVVPGDRAGRRRGRRAATPGWSRERLAATWARRARATSPPGATPITGVSEFPDLAETPVAREPAARAAAGGGLPRRARAPQAFEALRDRADARSPRPAPAAGLPGHARPGRRAHRPGRRSPRNLFQAGGIETAVRRRRRRLSGRRGAGRSPACVLRRRALRGRRPRPVAAALRGGRAPRRCWLAGTARAVRRRRRARLRRAATPLAVLAATVSTSWE